MQYYNCPKFGYYDSEYRAPSTRIYEKVNYIQEKEDEDGKFLLAHNGTNRGQENI